MITRHVRIAVGLAVVVGLVGGLLVWQRLRAASERADLALARAELSKAQVEAELARIEAEQARLIAEKEMLALEAQVRALEEADRALRAAEAEYAETRARSAVLHLQRENEAFRRANPNVRCGVGHQSEMIATEWWATRIRTRDHEEPKAAAKEAYRAWSDTCQRPVLNDKLMLPVPRDP